MKTECRLKFALFAGMLITAMVAIPSESFGQASVSVYAFSAPANLPSQDTYAATFLTDVEQGMMTGNWPVGNPLNPGYAIPITSGRVSVTNTIYTPSIYSWNASANPSGAFANEHGQLLMFAAKITDSTPFTLNQVSYWLGFPSDNDTNSGILAGLGYSQIGIGINWGPDGIPGTADDVTYTSGNGNSPVNEVLILDSGWGMEPSGGNQTPTSAESDFSAGYGNQFEVIGGYSLGSVSNSQTIYVMATPEFLNIIATSNNIWLVTWRSSGSFVLQQNTNLTTANWSDVTNTPNVVNYENQIAVTNTGGNGFYRLIHR